MKINAEYRCKKKMERSDEKYNQIIVFFREKKIEEFFAKKYRSLFKQLQLIESKKSLNNGREKYFHDFDENDKNLICFLPFLNKKKII